MRILGIIAFTFFVSTGVFAQQAQNTSKKPDNVQPASKGNQTVGATDQTQQRQHVDLNKVVPSKTHEQPAGATEVVTRKRTLADPNKVVKSNNEVK